jgi:hypothetical protein
MRLSATCLLLSIALTAAADAAENVTIARYNNTLVVTAPAEQAGPPAAILAQRLTVDFQDTSIADVAELLRSATALNVVVAPELLARNATVTLNAKDMELGNLLNWISTVGGVHYGWLNHALYFADKALEGPTRTRVYDVSDLVMSVPNFPGPDLTIPQGDGGGAHIIAPLAEPEPAMTTDELVDLLEKHIQTR